MEFIGPEGQQWYEVVNKNVLEFLIRTVKPKNNVYSLQLNKCQITDEMMKMLVKGAWNSLN